MPDRQDIIWIDCNPQAGQEMRNVHPFLVLSPRNFNNKTSLVSRGCKMVCPESPYGRPAIINNQIDHLIGTQKQRNMNIVKFETVENNISEGIEK